jgi:hypothetical protein
MPGTSIHHHRSTHQVHKPKEIFTNFHTNNHPSATAKPGTATNRGGTVTIDGFTITIPDNLLVEFPALFVPFAEFTTGNKPGQNEVSITGKYVIFLSVKLDFLERMIAGISRKHNTLLYIQVTRRIMFPIPLLLSDPLFRIEAHVLRDTNS